MDEGLADSRGVTLTLTNSMGGMVRSSKNCKGAVDSKEPMQLMFPH